MAADGDSSEGEIKEEETEAKSDISGTAEPTAKAVSLQYEDDDVLVTVSTDKEGIIPADSKLKVIPVLPDDKKTKDQYKEVEEKLKDKAKNENYSIAGFLAYDICFVDEDGKEQVFTGIVEGLVADHMEGAKGFGYDPIFYYPPYQTTLANVSEEKKNAVSHRGRALAQLLAYLEGDN